jgi:epoxide hydrolase-like predicted phosphatase
VSPSVEAVIFDFGGVVAQFYQPHLFRTLETRLGLQAGSLSAILWRSPEWRMAEVGAISDAEYWRRTAPRLGLESAAAIHTFQRDLFGTASSDPRMIDLIRRLRGRYRTALLSNASNAFDSKRLADRYGLGDLFDVIIISARVGLAKPDPAIYRLALKQLDCAPQATVFVDDFAPNVEAAAALGMRAIHFLGTEALIPALRQQGVEVPDWEINPSSEADR